MITIYRMVLAAIFFLACGPAFADETVTAPSGPQIPTLDDFLSGPDYWSPEMSPSGRFLAGVRRIEGQDFILTIDLNSENFDRKFSGVGDAYVNWIDWVTEDRMLISLTGYIDIRTGKQMTRQQLKDWTDKSRQIPRKYTRLVSMDRSSGESVSMFGDNKAINRNFSLGRVTDFLPDDPDHILMPARMGGDLDLFRVDVRDGSYERIAIGTDFTTAWFTDRDGEPAFRLNVNRRGTVLTVYAREDRENGKIKWRKVRKIRLDDNETSDAAAAFRVLFPGPTSETYYVSARRDDRDFAGIYLYDFEADEFKETIRESGRVDIEHAFFNRDTRELLGVYYYDDRLTIEMDDSGIQAHLDGLNTYFGDRANVVPIDSSEDGIRWLLKVSGPDIPPSYHYYDLDIAFEVMIGENQLNLRGKALGAAQVIQYTARDGLKLYGYLTRPVTAKAGDNPPLIIMPHGGPEMRDYFDFDLDVQILASQGYQVFQPNFRGSSGYGLTFAELGRRQWGQGMQTDIEDGYAHLLETGLADAGEACIFGYSYGGYAALAAATQTPDLYRCIIDGAGISDLEAFVKWQRKERGSDSEVYEYWLEHIGDPWSEKETLRRFSPAQNADRIVRPVLLLHGKDDGIVPFDQSKRMQKAMEKAGKPVKLVELEESGHRYMSDEAERLYYTEILTFLNQHLPVN
jgi:dipeptidyl aminopeptidase/acylaminoacyl peptidase